ncbi:MAG: hypothetical protein QOD60_676 [Solirubrobacterales bacterium]|nr:hypothetical protein [Solirubrobacterales bacterium]
MKASKKLSVGVIVACTALLGGAVFGGVADAKKKKSSNVANITAAPRSIVQSTGAGPTHRFGVTPVFFNVSKKFKGKTVAADSVILTVSLSGPAGSLDDTSFRLSNPKGRTAMLDSPGLSTSTTIGPLTITPNSPFGTCGVPPCPDPFNTVNGPGFVGTVGDNSLQIFTGTAMRGTWTLNIIDTDTNNGADALTSAKLSITAAKS